MKGFRMSTIQAQKDAKTWVKNCRSAAAKSHLANRDAERQQQKAARASASRASQVNKNPKFPSQAGSDLNQDHLKLTEKYR